MEKKQIECYEVEVKALVRNECTKRELKQEIENQMASISYTLEECEIKVK